MTRLYIQFALLVTLSLVSHIAHAQSSSAAETVVAQEPPDPNPGAVSMSVGLDFQSTYMFRGIRQHSTGIAASPWFDVGIAAYSGAGALQSVAINFGSWNSQHTGDTGIRGPSGKMWYESDFYATVGFGLRGGASVATTYTAYTSPNNTFTSVKEIGLKLSLDDSGRFGKAAFKPYAILAKELDTAVGVGQADGGVGAGTYFEIGVTPGYSGSRASVALPVKVGLSLDNYYELSGTDNRFGFASIAGIVTIPIGAASNYGLWNVHGGAEFQRLGTTTTALNGGARTRTIGSIGIGFSY